MYQQLYKETIAKEHRKRQYLLLPFFFVQFSATMFSVANLKQGKSLHNQKQNFFC
ncbi:hypothetical protein HMPREF9397_2278 [Streptococcus sanguinis SK1087]|uniref:Uncharacterized protein n=2 Tax=Streptococcus sanguinis TaxID=1305 RepID=F0IRY6_STRSA|nr:hypothetical protein HMPREF9384_0598 [Streptococcus sanguinis SK160]EGG38950.1 hypothetical protein HMPREF9397_2278 [Streptococcus sanguinis SK1087]